MYPEPTAVGAPMCLMCLGVKGVVPRGAPMCLMCLEVEDRGCPSTVGGRRRQRVGEERRGELGIRWCRGKGPVPRVD